jgi:exonuclease III
MSILGWNCRGLGLPQTVQELVRLIRTYRPLIVFICETRQGENKIKELKCRLGLKFCTSHVGKGKGAGIALYWDEQVDLEVLALGPRFIDVLIKNGPNNQSWRITFVYGEPKAAERHHMWTTLSRIKDNANAPWLMLGDFNETMWQHEHFSETKRSESRMKDFRRVLSHCGLHDLGCIGTPWTYDNRQKERKNIRDRLDRAVASHSWANLFPDAKVSNLISTRSDHLPILIEYEKNNQIP